MNRYRFEDYAMRMPNASNQIISKAHTYVFYMLPAWLSRTYSRQSEQKIKPSSAEMENIRDMLEQQKRIAGNPTVQQQRAE